MKKIFYILFAIAVSGNIHSQSQDVNDRLNLSSMSSPDVYSFEKYNLKKINQYTGKADISIPIYSITTGNINYPLVLSYDTGGIKVDQLASDVGLGWNLSRAVITRTVNQANDFNNTGNNLYDPTYVNSPGEPSSNYLLAQNKSNMGFFLQRQIGGHFDQMRRKIDFLPDVYNFYSSEFQTKFFFPVSGAVELIPQGSKITATRGKQTFPIGMSIGGTPIADFPTQDFFSIVIVSPNGIKYTFNDYDLSAPYYSTNFSDEYVSGYGNPYPVQISAWHITEIEDTNTGKKIQFTYDSTHSNPWIGSGSGQETFTYNKKVYAGSGTCNYYTPYQSDSYALNKESRIDVQKKRLKKITFENGEVSFYYNNDNGATSPISNNREDIYHGDFLTKIIIKNTETATIKTFELKYDYFVSNYNVGEFNPTGTFQTSRYKRLKLTEVKELGKNPYKLFYEEIKLPPVNSFAVDFLGYANGSSDITDEPSILAIKPTPKLYYYANQIEKSLLPFPVPNQSPLVLNGFFNRQANEIYAKGWSLNKIEYPTGGSSELTYESNYFQVFGENIKGGGLRIASQKLNDGAGGSRTMTYQYINTDGKSSGTLSSFPYFGHPTKRFFEVMIDYQYDPPQINPQSAAITNTTDWKLFNKSNLLEDITSGSYVGYSRVIEKEIGNGRTEFLFTSNDSPLYQNELWRHPQVSGTQSSLSDHNCISEFLIANSGHSAQIFTDNSIRRGKLLEQSIYSEQNQLLQKTTYDYYFEQKDSFQFTQPITVPLHTQNQDANAGDLMSARKKYFVGNFLLEEKKSYLYDKNNINNVNLTTAFYRYNDLNFLSNEQITSGLESQAQGYIYLSDITATNSIDGETISAAEFNAITALKSKNNLKQIIKTLKVRDGSMLFSERVKFKDWGNNKILPEFILKSKGDNALQNVVKYNIIDNTTGNPLEAQEEGGKKICYIWGYNKTLLVAKIENLAYSSISATLINNIATANQAALPGYLNTLRSNHAAAECLITTYTYKPLVGITTVTDPKGDKTTYNYDPYGRLQSIVDKNNSIISETSYNYKQ